MSKPLTIDQILMAYKRHPYKTNGLIALSGDEAKLAISKIVADIIKRSEPIGYVIDEPHAVDYQNGYNNGIGDYKDSLIETAQQYGLEMK